MLAMGFRRKAELAVRIAIGGSRRRQIQLLMTESLILSVLGGGAGLIVALTVLRTLLDLVPADMPRAAEAGLDGGVLVFTLGISLATGLLFGLLPALRGSDVNLVEALKATKSGNTRGHRGALSSPLIVIQVALTLMLLVGGSVLGKSFFQLRAVDRGFRSENVLAVEVNGGRLSGPDQPREVGQEIWSDGYRTLEAVRAVPGVISVATGAKPLRGGGGGTTWIQFQEYEDNRIHEGMIPAHVTLVSPEYFETLGIPIIRGEGLREWEGVNDWRRYGYMTGCSTDFAPFCSERAEFGKVVVSESFAAAAWPGENPIGKGAGYFGCCWTVAGVAADVSFRGVDDTAITWVDSHRIYIPWYNGTLLVRTAGDPFEFAPAIREAVLSVDDLLTIDVSTLDDRIYDSLARPRFHMLTGGIFAAVALLLALVGLYGVVAYSVAHRTHEIGVRIALGAQREDIRALVVRNGLAPVALGVVLGIAGVLASVRVLEALLYGASALDPPLIAGLSVILLFVTGAACYLPARRASSVDPVVALAHE